MTNTDILKGERRRIIEQIREEVKAEVLERVLTIVEKHDPSTNRETNKAYWGNTLREELQTLWSKNEVIEKELLGKE